MTLPRHIAGGALTDRHTLAETPCRSTDNRSARIMRVTRISIATIAVAAILSLTACAGGGAATSSGQKVDGGTIVYAHQQEPACVFGGWIEQAYLSYQVLDSLVSLDENHKVVPWLATAWKQSDDGLTWTFTLKKDVT